MNRSKKSPGAILLLLLGVSCRLAFAQAPPPAEAPAPQAPPSSVPASSAPADTTAAPSVAPSSPSDAPASSPTPSAGALPSAGSVPVPVTLPVSPDYVLQPGDVIAITMAVPGDTPVTTPENGLTLPLDGRISFSFVRGIQATGRTRSQLEDALILGVKRYIRNPSITVNLVATPYNYISVSGAVEKPGQFQYRSGLTVYEAITAAGGYKAAASKTAYVYRKDSDGKSQFLPVDLIRLFNGDATQNLSLFPGDMLTINEALIYINGNVKTPGMLTLRVADTVGKAIAASGGILPGSDLRSGFIRRGEQSIPVDLRSVVEGNVSGAESTLPLLAGDVLNVPLLTSKVIVIGETGNTGPVMIAPQSNDKALDVVAQAGVNPRTSDLRKILLIRNVNGNNEVRTELDLSSKGPQSDNVILQNGDILYIPTRKERDRNQALLNATILTQLLGALRTF